MSTVDNAEKNLSEDGWKIAGKQKMESIGKKAPDGYDKKLKTGTTAWKPSDSSRYSKIFKNERDSTHAKDNSSVFEKPSQQPEIRKVLSKKDNTISSSIIPLKQPIQKQPTSSVKHQDTKTKNVALFDMLMTSVPVTTSSSQLPVLSATGSKKLSSSSSKVHPNALRNLETVLLPKSFIQPLGSTAQKKKNEKPLFYPKDKAKKVKNLSVFKKKVLKERMKMHIKMEIKNEIQRKQQELREQQQQQQKQSSANSSLSSSSLSLRIYNFTKHIDWKDELEKDEIINNVKDLLIMIYESWLSSSSSTSNTQSVEATSIFQFISSLSIWKWKSHPHTSSSTHNSFSTVEVGRRDSLDLSSLISFVDIKFKTKEMSDFYYQMLKNMIIAGDSLHCLYSDNDNGNYVEQLLTECFYEEGKNNNESEEVASEGELLTVEKKEEEKPKINEDSCALQISESPLVYTLIIENMITEDDNITASDDVQEILNDVYSLCSMATSLNLNITTTSSTNVLPTLLWIEKRETNENQKNSTMLEVEEKIVPFLGNRTDDEETDDNLNDDKSDCFIIILQSIEDSLIICEKFITREREEEKGRENCTISWCDYSQFSRNSFISSSINLHLHSDINNSKGFYGIGFLNFLSEEEYEVEDEREEIIENVRSLLSSELLIEKILFVRSIGSLSDSENEADQDELSSVYHSVYLLFSSIDMFSLLQQLTHLKSHIISGESLKLEVVFFPFSADKEASVDSYYDSVEALRQRTHLLVSSDSSQAVIFTSTSSIKSLKKDNASLSSLSVHEEEVLLKQSFLSYLHEQCGELPSFQRLLVGKNNNRSFAIEKEELGTVDTSTRSPEYLICLQYSSFLSATYTMSYFDNLVVSGQQITAYLDPNHHIPPSSTSVDRVVSTSVLQPSATVINDNNAPVVDEFQQPGADNNNENQNVNVIIQQYIHDKEHWKNYFDCVYFEFFFQPLPSSSTSLSVPLLSSDDGNVKEITSENAEENKQENEIIVNEEDISKRLLSEKEFAEKERKSIFTKAVTLARIGSHAVPTIDTIPVRTTILLFLFGFLWLFFIFFVFSFLFFPVLLACK
jgi:hypothetical protein